MELWRRVDREDGVGVGVEATFAPRSRYTPMETVQWGTKDARDSHRPSCMPSVFISLSIAISDDRSEKEKQSKRVRERDHHRPQPSIVWSSDPFGNVTRPFGVP